MLFWGCSTTPVLRGIFVNVLLITKHKNTDTERLDSEHSELESVLQDHHTPSFAVSHPKTIICPVLQSLTPRSPYSQSCNVSPQDHHTPSLAMSHPNTTILPVLQCLTQRSPYSQSCSVSPHDHHTPSLALSHPKATILPVLQCLTPRSPYPILQHRCLTVFQILYPLQFNLFPH